jgi:hypothetical protein
VFPGAHSITRHITCPKPLAIYIQLNGRIIVLMLHVFVYKWHCAIHIQIQRYLQYQHSTSLIHNFHSVSCNTIMLPCIVFTNIYYSRVILYCICKWLPNDVHNVISYSFNCSSSDSGVTATDLQVGSNMYIYQLTCI